jgi:hypothetical protein
MGEAAPRSWSTPFVASGGGAFIGTSGTVSVVSATFQTYADGSVIMLAFCGSVASGTVPAVTSISFAGLTFSRLTTGGQVSGLPYYQPGNVAALGGIGGLELWWAQAPTAINPATLSVHFSPAVNINSAQAGWFACEVSGCTTLGAPFDPGMTTPVVLAQHAPGSIAFNTTFPTAHAHTFTEGTVAQGVTPPGPAGIVYIAAALVGTDADLYLVFTASLGANGSTNTPATPGFDVKGSSGTTGLFPSVNLDVYAQEEPEPAPPADQPKLAPLQIPVRQFIGPPT